MNCFLVSSKGEEHQSLKSLKYWQDTTWLKKNKSWYEKVQQNEFKSITTRQCENSIKTQERRLSGEEKKGVSREEKEAGRRGSGRKRETQFCKIWWNSI